MESSNASNTEENQEITSILGESKDRSTAVSTQAEMPSSSSEEPTMITQNMEEMVSQLTDGFLSEVKPQLLELREKTKEIT
jgi:hypothetical protein